MHKLILFYRILFLGLLLAPALQAQSQEVRSVEELTLAEYHPKSIYNLPESSIVKARYPAIDMHSHPYLWDSVSISGWVQRMDSVGLQKAVILTYATGSLFDSLVEIFDPFKGRFILFCGFDYSGYNQPGFSKEAILELVRCFNIGARGVGELGDKGRGLFYNKPEKAFGMHIDDTRMDPILEKCAELNMPVVVHVADPKWMYEDMDAHNDGLMNAVKCRLDTAKNILGHQAMINTLENAVSKHPSVTFVACHFANCSYDIQILARLFDKHPNLFADISARYGETAPIPRTMRRFYKAYQDRLLYGTDMGTNTEMYRSTFRILESADEHFYDKRFYNYHWPLHGFSLEAEILEKVYRLNALEVLNQN